MNGAYEGLMKAAPQAMPQQSMGGQAQTVGWKDVPPVANKHIDQVLQQMDALHQKYADGGDILPEDASHMHHLRQQLQHLHQWEQHSLGQAKEQGNFQDDLSSMGQESELIRALKSAGAGKVPPSPAQARR